MSRSKRARAKERKHGSVRPPAGPDISQSASGPAEASRVGEARRRAAAAKLGIGGVALVTVGASMALARVTYAGHSKHPARPLAIPQPLYRVVRQNLLQGGILAPATAPPDATTSTS
jgi:hypothetical protein